MIFSPALNISDQKSEAISIILFNSMYYGFQSLL